MDRSYDAIIVGGGFAGGALATVLARAGKSVLVLEKTTAYRDLVRGEWIAPWGVVEAQRLGIYDALIAAGGHHVRYHVEYGEGIDPAEAEGVRLDMTSFLPRVPGPLCIGHPAACAALAASAETAGAKVIRGIADVAIEAGDPWSVRYFVDGREEEARAPLVIGADGRNSTVRRVLGLRLHRDTPHHWFSGLLVEGAEGWPDDLQTMGTERDVQFFVFPQGEGRLRLYLSYPLEQKTRLAGEEAPQRFLEAFRLASVPHAEAVAGARIAGPCRSVPNEDTWVDRPAAAGLVLVGDAAGWNDPIIGQGLSISLRDVRIVSELILGATRPDDALFEPYVEERTERLRRLRFCAQIDSAIHAEFGEEAQARRLAIRAKRATDPAFLLATAAVMIGPEILPAEAFSEDVRRSAMELAPL